MVMMLLEAVAAAAAKEAGLDEGGARRGDDNACDLFVAMSRPPTHNS